MKTIEDVYRERINNLFIRGYSIETIALCMRLSEEYVRDCIRANEKSRRDFNKEHISTDIFGELFGHLYGARKK